MMKWLGYEASVYQRRDKLEAAVYQGQDKFSPRYDSPQKQMRPRVIGNELMNLMKRLGRAIILLLVFLVRGTKGPRRNVTPAAEWVAWCQRPGTFTPLNCPFK